MIVISVSSYPACVDYNQFLTYMPSFMLSANIECTRRVVAASIRAQCRYHIVVCLDVFGLTDNYADYSTDTHLRWPPLCFYHNFVVFLQVAQFDRLTIN